MFIYCLLEWVTSNRMFSVPKFTVDISEAAFKVIEEILLFNPEDRLKLRQITERRHVWYLTQWKAQNQSNRNTNCDNSPVIIKINHEKQLPS